MVIAKLYCFVIFLQIVVAYRSGNALFPVSIIHMNDFHSRFEETNERSTPCKPEVGEKCIGGYARAVTIVKQLMKDRMDTNPIYLNAGDNFQGTLWYNILKGNVTSYFLNLLNADALTLGNHEFDDGVDGLIPFLEAIEAPVIISNVDDSKEKSFHGKYTKSIIIDRYDRKIGVIGVVLSTIHQIARIGKLKFLDESESVRAEAARLKKQGINIIIVLSHCGLDVDYRIAKTAGSDIDVIVGGHTHTFMFTGSNPPGPDFPLDIYPAIVTQNKGHKVLIVQASAYTKYIGDLTVYFDLQGEVVGWEGNPMYLDSNIVPDPNIIAELKQWKDIVDIEGLRTMGTSSVILLNSNCKYEECNMGNLVTDLYLHYYMGLAKNGDWTYASIGLSNAGGIRTTLNNGTITYADLVTVLPFENTIDCFELRGDHLFQTLEYSIQSSNWPSPSGHSFFCLNMLQVTGLNIIYNISQPIGQRVISVDVLCNACKIPRYSPLKKTRFYRVMANSFMASGGDGFDVLAVNKKNHLIGPVDIDVLTKYVKDASPIQTEKYGRITIWK